MASAAKDWLREHAAGERRLVRVFNRYFKDQTARVARSISRLRNPSAADLAEVFDADAEHKLLMEVLPVPLAGLACAGAIRVLEASKRRQKQKHALTQPRTRKDEEFDVAVAEEVDEFFDIPENIREAIKTSLGELIEQPYWADIQTGTSDSLTKILADAIEEGLNGSQLAKRINAALGGQQKVRARLIARTETTAMFNAGHQSVYDSLSADGLVEGKTWMAISDDKTRESHESLNGKTVKADEDFSVGETAAPYPGHHSLPAGERVNCRCTTVAAFKDE